MPVYELNDAPVFEPIPEGSVLQAEVVNCEERDSFWDIDRNDPSKGKRREVSFRFVILEPGEFDGRMVFGNTSTVFSNHPDCRLYMWVQELLAVDELPVGFKVDTDTLIGLPCKVVIGNRVKKDDNGKVIKRSEFVSDVIRLTDTAMAGDTF